MLGIALTDLLITWVVNDTTSITTHNFFDAF